MLATSFNRRSPILRASHGFLSEDEMRARLPSIFAEAPHDSRSARYTYIPTIDVVRGLGNEGFRPTFACQAKPRDDDRFAHTKHMMRFRRADDASAAEARELIMVNSHDGTSSYQLLAGVFSFVCQNGLVVGDKYDEVRVHHKGDIVGEVIDGAYRVVENFAEISDDIARMKAIALRPAEAQIMAETAAELRFNLGEGEQAPIDPSRLLQARRRDDASPSLWHTFNRLQENTIRGGIHGTTKDANGRRRNITTREVKGIDQNITLNRMLFRMAQLVADQKTP